MIPAILKNIQFVLGIILISYHSGQAQTKADSINNAPGSIEKIQNYFDVGDAKLYYEVYGTGSPVLLLHGGLYGSIDEFKEMIPKLSRGHKVIAISTRGHGKSEIGTKSLSYKLFAEDAIAILRKETNEKALVIGFSDGGTTAYILASEFPDDIRKVVALGGGLSHQGYNENGVKWLKNFSAESLEKTDPQFVMARKSMMPAPERWNEFIMKIKMAWMEPVYVTDAKAQNIKCPVLIIAGDRDYFRTTEQFVAIYRTIPSSQLAIIPNSGHTGIMKNPLVFDNYIMPFLIK